MSKALRRALWVAWSGLVLVVLLALGLPALIRSRINTGLADMKEGYVGHIEQVSIDWLTPGVTLHELRIERPKQKVGAPFLTVKRLEVAILFRSLFEPRISLRFVQPVVSFVDGPTAAEQQWGPPFTLENLREKLPFDLGAVQLADMELHLRYFRARPPVDAYLQKVQVTASPLDNCIKQPPQGCDARADLEATLMAGAGLRAQARMQYDLKFSLDGSARVRQLDLTQLNPALIQYAEVDIQKGELDLDARARLRGSHYRFTLLPDVEQLEVLGGERDKTRAGREPTFALLAGLIERRDEDWSVIIEGIQGRDNLKWDLQRRPKTPRQAGVAP